MGTKSAFNVRRTDPRSPFWATPRDAFLTKCFPRPHQAVGRPEGDGDLSAHSRMTSSVFVASPAAASFEGDTAELSPPPQPLLFQSYEELKRLYHTMQLA